MRTKLFPILLCLGLGGCTETATRIEEASVTVLVDRSDTTMAEITFEDVRPFFEAEGLRFTSYRLRVRRLAESATDTVREARLDGWSELRQNTEMKSRRNKERSKFFREAEQLFTFPDARPSSHSAILKPLAEELESLSQRKGSRDVVLVSDLAENSSAWSAYGNGLAGDPDTLAARLAEAYSLEGNYEGITLWVLHRPKGAVNVQRFEHLVLVYRKLFEPRGLILKPVANLR